MKLSKFKTLQLIHASFCLSILLFGTVSFFATEETLNFDASLDQEEIFYPLFPILAIVQIAAGLFLFRKLLSAIDLTISPDEKITKYQTVFLIKSALFEASALMNITAFLISSNSVFLIVAGAVLAMFVYSRPTRDGIIEALNLSYPDTESL